MTAQIESKLHYLTEKVKRLLFDYGKYELAKILNISKNTLDKRLSENTWTYREKLIIDELLKDKA